VSYVAGQFSGMAAEFDGESAVEILITDSNDVTLEEYKTLTVTCWVKPDTSADDDGWDMFVAKGGLLDGWHLGQYSTTSLANFRAGGDLYGTTEIYDPCDSSDWHMITGVFNNGTGTLYVNGGIQSTYTPLSIVKNLTSLTIGSTELNEDYSTYGFAGVIDDVKIYNYALTPIEIADMYCAENPDSNCFACKDPPDYDYNNKCIADLGDFVIFASTWLECGKWPVDTCN